MSVYVGPRKTLLALAPKWVLPKSSLDIDLAGNRAFLKPRLQTIDSVLTCTRTGVGMAQSTSGVWSSFGTNILRRTDIGALSEAAATNLALWCRDFTNAAWVKVSVTAALNQIGIDAAANSASLLTATGANGTVLQTIALSSASRTLSFFVKRITGSGTVSISQDGVSWTVITVTAGWTRVTLTATQLNPVIGFQIATSGDAIAVDFAQLEAGTFASSPILTTTASAIRNGDSITTTTSATAAIRAAKAALAITEGIFGAGGAGVCITFAIGAGGQAMSLIPTTQGRMRGSGIADCTLGSGTTAGVVRCAGSFDGVNVTSRANGGTKVSAGSTWAGSTGSITIAGRFSNEALNGYLKRIAFCPAASNYDGMTA